MFMLILLLIASKLFLALCVIYKEREREKGALRPINASRLYTDE